MVVNMCRSVARCEASHATRVSSVYNASRGMRGCDLASTSEVAAEPTGDAGDITLGDHAVHRQREERGTQLARADAFRLVRLQRRAELGLLEQRTRITTHDAKRWCRFPPIASQHGKAQVARIGAANW